MFPSTSQSDSLSCASKNATCFRNSLELRTVWVAARRICSSRDSSWKGSPSPVRSQTSFTPNSRQISDIVRSLRIRSPFSICQIKFSDSPRISENSFCVYFRLFFSFKSTVRNSFIRLFTVSPPKTIYLKNLAMSRKMCIIPLTNLSQRGKVSLQVRLAYGALLHILCKDK